MRNHVLQLKAGSGTNNEQIHLLRRLLPVTVQGCGLRTHFLKRGSCVAFYGEGCFSTATRPLRWLLRAAEA